MAISMQDASVYTNVGGLNAISQLGREDSPEALREVAKQFESMFINIMLKGMRAGEEALFSENYLRSNETKFHQESFDNQISLDIANAGGVGLADTLHRQLMQRYEPASASSRDFDRALNDVRRYPGSARDVAQPSPLTELPAGTLDKPGMTPVDHRFASPDAFVQQLLPIAESVAPELGVDPRVMVAQSALETGWGKHMITDANGAPSYNLFGIKAGSQWQGRTTDILTTEYREGSAVKERAAFRAYDSYEDSFADYLDFLSSKPRYAQALAAAGDHVGFSNALQKAGYATDPDYASKIQRIVQSDYLDNASESGEQASR